MATGKMGYSKPRRTPRDLLERNAIIGLNEYLAGGKPVKSACEIF